MRVFVAGKERGSLNLSGRATIASNQGPLNKSDPDGTRFQIILGKGKALKLIAPDKAAAKR